MFTKLAAITFLFSGFAQAQTQTQTPNGNPSILNQEVCWTSDFDGVCRHFGFNKAIAGSEVIFRTRHHRQWIVTQSNEGMLYKGPCVDYDEDGYARDHQAHAKRLWSLECE